MGPELWMNVTEERGIVVGFITHAYITYNAARAQVHHGTLVQVFLKLLQTNRGARPWKRTCADETANRSASLCTHVLPGNFQRPRFFRLL